MVELITKIKDRIQRRRVESRLPKIKKEVIASRLRTNIDAIFITGSRETSEKGSLCLQSVSDTLIAGNTVMKKIIRNSGSILCGLMAISAALAVCGMAGIAAQYTFNLSITALLFALSIFTLVYSRVYTSMSWAMLSLSSFCISIMLLIEFLRGGGHWLPVVNGRMWCMESLFFTAIGAAVFYFSEWRKTGLTRLRKTALASFGLSVPVVSALYLCGAPLWLPYLALYAALGVLLYGYRVPLFWNHYRKNGVNNIIEDAVR